MPSFFPCDVTSKKQIHERANEVEEKLGLITSWINSAGVSQMKPFLESEEEFWDLTLNVNLKATFLCCQVAVEKNVGKRGRGNPEYGFPVREKSQLLADGILRK